MNATLLWVALGLGQEGRVEHVLQVLANLRQAGRRRIARRTRGQPLLHPRRPVGRHGLRRTEHAQQEIQQFAEALAAEVDARLDRELGQLEFNRRVLAQAEDTTVPLLERP